MLPEKRTLIVRARDVFIPEFQRKASDLARKDSEHIPFAHEPLAAK